MRNSRRKVERRKNLGHTITFIYKPCLSHLTGLIHSFYNMIWSTVYKHFDPSLT